MIAQIEEFEPPKTPDSQESQKITTKVLLRPNSETLFADLCLLNQKAGNSWTDKDALEVEAKILVRSFHRLLSTHTHSLFVARYITTALLGPGPTSRKDREQSLPHFPSSHTASITTQETQKNKWNRGGRGICEPQDQNHPVHGSKAYTKCYTVVCLVLQLTLFAAPKQSHP
jgi:hypothetical protein